MEIDFFWRKWPQSQKNLFLAFLGLFFVGILGSIIAWLFGASGVIQWETQALIEPVQVVVKKLGLNFIELPITAESLRITETIYGSDLQISVGYATLFFVVFCLCWIVFLSTTTYLSRFWYLVSIPLFLLILIGFRLEQLGFVGQYNHTLMGISIALFLLPSYYFHSFRPESSLWLRIGVFAFNTAVWAGLIVWGSEMSFPLVRVMHYGILSPLAIFVVFAVIVAHDILVGFIYLLTKNHASEENNLTSGNHKHLFVFALIYLGNLFVAYLLISRSVDWSLLYIHPFVLFPISALVGLWAMRQRVEANFEKILPFEPLGSLLYLAMAVLSMFTLSYFHVTNNDPMVEIAEDVILWSHMGVGLLFIVYVYANYFSLLAEGRSVYKILYKPMNMPYFTARLAGVIGMAAFFFKSDMVSINQGWAGYYNYVGDVYALEEDVFTSEQYYKLGSQYGYTNHRSNYALYSLANSVGDKNAANYYLQQAVRKNPSPYAYANLSLNFAEREKFFDALFVLREGLEKYPEEQALLVNMGVLLGKTRVVDSAMQYLQLAEDGPFAQQARSNQLALIAKDKLEFALDSLLGQEYQYLPAQSNQLHLRNSLLLPQPNEQGYDSLRINGFQLAWLNNSVLSALPFMDSTQAQVLAWYANDSTNAGFFTTTQILYSLSAFESGNVRQAIPLLEANKLSSRQFSGYYAYLIGCMAAEYGQWEYASHSFEEAYQKGVAYGQAGKWISDLHLGKWKTLADSLKNEPIAEGIKGNQGLYALWASITGSDSVQTELATYWRAMFEPDWNLTERLQAIQSISSDILKHSSYYDLIIEKINRGNLFEAEQILAQWELIAPAEFSKELRFAQLRLALAQKADKAALAALLSAQDIQEMNDPYVFWARAQVFPEQAAALYAHLAKNIFFEEGVVAAANYFEVQGKSDKAYLLLVEALQHNPYSIPIAKAYVLQALRNGLDSYAYMVLNDLKKKMKPEDFSGFEQEVKGLASKAMDWNP
ncbi:hypothetical protein QWY31_15455 [Cytophagales bacterium LB-30]|uniref:Tetratricopeptide repeat protein n=1 Tax=Shiella aurantiaca TaxID=3058365 RepID=A0ABT8F8Z8_9BACT|nr:hypothetical protein [Shiella aurantiaca]MDN4166907.1 hypothetical protein [Shiella aurantiaca]